MKWVRVFMSSGFLFGAFGHMAHAQTVKPLVFHHDSKAPETPLASAFFGGYAKTHPGTVLKTAAIDVNHDGIGEVVVQIDGKGTCNQSGCLTSILMHKGTHWSEIFHQHETEIGLKNTRGFSEIVTPRGLWSWNGNSYQPDISSMWSVIDGNGQVPSEANLNAVTDYYDGQRMDWLSWPVPNNTPDTVVMTSTDPYVNGISQGSLLVVRNGTVLLCVFGTRLVVLDNETNGLRDIAVQSIDGVETFQWDGHNYRSVETTYASRVTPAP